MSAVQLEIAKLCSRIVELTRAPADDWAPAAREQVSRLVSRIQSLALDEPLGSVHATASSNAGAEAGGAELVAMLQLFREVFEAAPTPLAFFRTDGSLWHVNRRFEETFGYSRADVDSLESWYEKAYPDPVYRRHVQDTSQELFEAARQSGQGIPMIERKVAHKNGRTLTGLMSGSRFGNTLVVSFFDITELRRVESEVRRTRDLLRRVVDSSPDWIFAKDLQQRFLLVNEQYARAVGSEPDAMFGRSDADFWSPVPCVADGSSGRDPNWVAVTANGEHLVFDTHRKPLIDEQGHVYGVLGYARDVTEERRAAEAVRRSLEEKVALLGEVHHRVRNNLQIVSGLLYFQEQKAHLPEDRALFVEAQARLWAMKLVHDELYRSSELARVNLPEYLGALTLALRASFPQADCRIEVVAEPLDLPAERAMTCGMITCELVMNAFKHAFPNGRPGSVSLGVRREAEGVVLTVDDDGVGFPADFSPANTGSFGWGLVRRLAATLGGSVVASSRAGAHVRVSFPKEK